MRVSTKLAPAGLLLLLLAPRKSIDLSDSRPRILIDLAASRAEDADFSAELLKLARLAGPKDLTP